MEDDKDVRQVIEKFLGGPDRRLLGAGTGLDGLAIIQSEKPDLVILDFFLPDMVAVKFIPRAKELRPAMPIIIVSSFWNMQYAKLAIADGAVDFIPKPIDPAQLMETVNSRLAADRDP